MHVSTRQVTRALDGGSEGQLLTEAFGKVLCFMTLSCQVYNGAVVKGKLVVTWSPGETQVVGSQTAWQNSFLFPVSLDAPLPFLPLRFLPFDFSPVF